MPLDILTMICIVVLVNTMLILIGMDKALVAFANIFATLVVAVSFIVGGLIW